MQRSTDAFSKSLLCEALSRVGEASAEVEVPAADVQKIDVYFVPDPRRAAERARMGRTGELCGRTSLFESFSTTPGIAEFRACLRKQLTLHHVQTVRARKVTPNNRPIQFPGVTIISPGRPKSVLEGFGFHETAPGIYESSPALAAKVVVASELPDTRDTLLFRLLGKGKIADNAVRELEALPADSWESLACMPLVLTFRWHLNDPKNEEREMDPQIRARYDEFVQKHQQIGIEKGIEKGIERGRQQEAMKMLARQLTARFGRLSARTAGRLKRASLTELEEWGDRLMSAEKLAQVFGGAR